MLHNFPKEVVFILEKIFFCGTGIAENGNDLHIRKIT
jgi:hypothetical protein